MDDDDDESLSTFLAYTKSPKTSKRTSFQEELKKAVSSRVSRQQAVEESENSDYSEEFESDDSLNDYLQETKTVELKKQKSVRDFHLSEDEESPGKLSFIKSKKPTDINSSKRPDHSMITNDNYKGDHKNALSKSPDKDGTPTPRPRESRMKHPPSQEETKTVELKKQKSLRDFHFSEDEESPGKLSFIKSKKPTDINSSKRPDHSVITNDNYKGDHKNALSKSPDKEGTPTPRPRESRMKHPPSPVDSASVFEESFKPTPQHRNLLKKSSHLEDTAEGKQPSTKLSSLSAPSSLTRLNDTVPISEKQSFSERCSPEGYRKSNPPSPPSQLKSLSITGDENVARITKESMLLKDLRMDEVDGPGSTEPHDSGTKSASVFEMLMMDVKEKSMKQEDKDPIPEENRASQSSIDRRLNQKHRQQTLDPQKDSGESLELGRSKSSSKKRSTKESAPKPRYLGTLTVLDKSVNDNNCEVEAADTLRAAVYQNWLEKKKVFVKELHQMKKAKEEQEREKIKMESTIKKEEAMAAFMAWKTEKKKETKQNQVKQKLEQKKKMDELQEIASKKEECRKAFEKWKEAKDNYLREKALKQKLTEMDKIRKEQTMKMEKANDSKSAFKKWNERKEQVLNEKKKQKRCEKMKLKEIKAEKEEQEKTAQELYEKWLKRKERQEIMEKKQKRLLAILNDDGPPPWSPPGNTISAGR